MEKKDLKKRIIFGNDMKDYLMNYEYDNKIKTFDEFWAVYQSRADKLEGGRYFSPVFRTERIFISAVSLILLIIITTFVIFKVNQTVLANQINRGNLFLISLSAGNPEFSRNGQTKKLSPEKPLKAGDIIITGGSGSCDIQVVNRALIRIDKNTRVALGSISDGTNKLRVKLFIERGALLMKPEALKEGELFNVETPSAMISVTGTRFMAEVSDSGGTEVAVSEGKVRIVPKLKVRGIMNGTIELSAGHSVSIPGPGESGVKLPSVKEITEDESARLNLLSENHIIKNVNDTAILKFNSPPGAGVYLDGRLAGYAPLQTVLNKNIKVDIRISSEGFEDYTLTAHEISGNETLSPILKKLTNTAGITGAIMPGELAWEKPVSLSNIDREAAIYSGRIYIPDGGNLKILSTAGELLKSIPVLYYKGSLTRCVIDRGTVYIGSDKGGLYAFTPDGDPLWNNKNAGKELFGAFPAASSGIVAVPSLDKGILVFNSSGEMLDSIPLERDEPVYSSPLIIKNGTMLIYGTEKGNVAAYDILKKKTIWKKTYIDSRILFPIIGDDLTAVIFYRNAGAKVGIVTGITPSDGKLRWQKAFPELSRTVINPLFSGGKAVFASNDPESGKAYLIVINTADGAIISRSTVNTPVSDIFLYDGNIYIASDTGKIICYNIKMKKTEWMFESGFNPGLIIADNNGVYILAPSRVSKIYR
jgi:outer membrane protein assembly factor BamB